MTPTLCPNLTISKGSQTLLQVSSQPQKRPLPLSKRCRQRTESHQSPRPGVLHICTLLGSVFPAEYTVRFLSCLYSSRFVSNVSFGVTART